MTFLDIQPQMEWSAEPARPEDRWGWEATERMIYATMAALATVAAPLLFYRFTFPHSPDDIRLAPWVIAPVFGPMVFQLISRPRPEWGWGLAFAAFLGVVFGVWAGLRPPFDDGGTWPPGQAALIGGFFFVLTFLSGMLGASAASLLVRAIGHERAWRAGASIVVLEVVVAAILVGILG
jgi:hypothetical protein